MNSVFILHHSYELDNCEETKLIGVYSTHSEAAFAIERLKNKPGFEIGRMGLLLANMNLTKIIPIRGSTYY